MNQYIYIHDSPCEQSKNLNCHKSIELHVTTLNFGHYIYKPSYKKIVLSDPSPSFKTTNRMEYEICTVQILTTVVSC